MLTTFAFRCCVPGQKIVVVRENPAKKEGKSGENLDRRSLIDVTLQHLVILARKLGAKVSMMVIFIKKELITSKKILFVGHSGLIEKNVEILIEIWKFQVDPTEQQVETCAQLARSFFNFNVTVDDFAALMESAENYRFLYITLAISSF